MARSVQMKKVEIVDIDKVQELLFAYAEGDYTVRMDISDKRDERDVILAGINMLGEELESSTVSKDYFESIYNAISDAVIVTDRVGKVTRVNNAVRIILGKKRPYLLKKDVRDVFPSQKAKRVITEVIGGGSAVGSFESTSLVKKTLKHWLCTITEINSKIDTHKGFLLIVKDITQEKTLENEVLNAVITAEEKEKRRLAYDLHDALGQELNSVKMMFESLMVMNKGEVQYDEVLELCRSIVNDSIETTRNLSHGLMPKSLEDGALFSAFHELEEKTSKLLNLIVYSPQEEYLFSKQYKINIYRVVQEFITNSLKHGKAKEVVINTYNNAKGYHFDLSDDGIGFDKEKATNGRGLKNIESRLKVIGANYAYTSVIGEGTHLIFSFK